MTSRKFVSDTSREIVIGRFFFFFQAKDGARANKGPRAERVLTIRYRYFATLYRGHAR